MFYAPDPSDKKNRISDDFADFERLLGKKFEFPTIFEFRLFASKNREALTSMNRIGATGILEPLINNRRIFEFFAKQTLRKRGIVGNSIFWPPDSPALLGA